MTKAETVIMRKRKIKVPSYRNVGYESKIISKYNSKANFIEEKFMPNVTVRQNQSQNQ